MKGYGKTILQLVLVVLSVTAGSRLAHADSEPEVMTLEDMKSVVFYSGDDFRITLFDLFQYLRPAEVETNVYDWPPLAQFNQGLTQLYAMEVLYADAAEMPSKADIEWLGKHNSKRETIVRYLDARVEQAIAETDWDLRAKEYYLVNGSEFEVGPKVTVQTFLLRTNERTWHEALHLAEEAVAGLKDTSFESFEALVREISEDEAGVKSGGLIEKLTLGATVRSFEEAAFALQTPGQISEPVVSQYGVHVIRLVERHAAEVKPFEEVRSAIVAKLQSDARVDYRSALQSEARVKEPPGLVIHQEAINRFSSTLEGARNRPVLDMLPD